MSYSSVGSSSNYSSTSTTTSNTSNREINRILFNFTKGDLLAIDGRDYRGYFNITNDNFYTGREVTAQSTILETQDNALANFIKEKYYFNRPPQEVLTLPYGFKDIKYEPGDYVNQNNLNEKLKKLNDNFLQLFNYTSVENNDLPENYSGFIGVSSNATDFGHLDIYATDLGVGNTGIRRDITTWNAAADGFRDVIHFKVLPRTFSPDTTGHENPTTFLSIFASTSAIYAFTGYNITQGTTFTFRTSTVNINGRNTRTFGNISAITTNDKDSLYISDVDQNQIYRMYIDPLINDARVSDTDIEYLNNNDAVINTTGRSVLSSVSLLEYSKNELFTYNRFTNNSGNVDAAVVVLNDDLTYNRKFKAQQIVNQTVKSMAVNPVDDCLYMLLDDFQILKVSRSFEEETSTIPIRKSDYDIGNGEEPTKIIFSKNDSNIFYILSNNNAYKYYNIGSNAPIGRFNWNTTGNYELSTTGYKVIDADILTENNDHDSFFVYSKDQTLVENQAHYRGIDKILRFNEKNTRISVLDSQLFRTFDLNDILVKDQYFNNITLNKSFKKLINNLDILASNITSNFLTNYNDQENLVLTARAVLSADAVYPKSYDMFIGSNEVVTPQNLNRCLDNILKYQNFVLNNLQSRLTNAKYAKTEPVYFGI